ncbi:hypothetical protein QJQ45_026830 [Haematococcus lacustris]|nr:hypothetical protein QJQ45_026830 [Haematococcus lacustris]
MRCLSFISVLVCTGAVLLAGIASPAAAQPVPAPLQGYPFAVCNHAPGTPYNWTVVRVTSDASFTTIDSVITLKACTRGACCNAQLAKLEWNVGAPVGDGDPDRSAQSGRSVAYPDKACPKDDVLTCFSLACRLLLASLPDLLYLLCSVLVAILGLVGHVHVPGTAF